MLVIAKTIKDKEYIHSIHEMYEVPKRSADKICEIMNNVRWELKTGETWHVYEESIYEPNGKLSIRNGVVKLRRFNYCGFRK